MQREAWFFVGLFVFIFVIWIAIGGPGRGIALKTPSLGFTRGTTTSLSGGTYLSLPHSPFGIGDSTVVLPGSSNGGSITNYWGNPTITRAPLEGIGYGTPSPYQSSVSLSHYVSGAGSSDPTNESISLSLPFQSSLPVDLSGWTLESEATGAAIVIPQGSAVPASGIINSVSDIVLQPGEQAIIISGRSPIGASFKENKCIGYFAQFQRFSPSLPSSCPAPSDELRAHYGGDYIRDAKCIDYVNGLSRCQVMLSPPVGLSGACQSFLVKYLNYNGCIDAHEGDKDFSGTTWRIYLGNTNSMWRASHEVVKLLDKQGNTVDAFSY